MSSETAPIRRKGKVKWFNVVKGYGFIVPEDGEPDVFVHQNAIKMDGFRSLDEGEEVEFEAHDTEKGIEAKSVTGPEGANCKGTARRPMPKRRYPRLKCYNCGRFSDHIAAKCPFAPGKAPQGAGASPVKLCYQCKSDQHLIKDCPENPVGAGDASPKAGRRAKPKGAAKLTNGDILEVGSDGSGGTTTIISQETTTKLGPDGTVSEITRLESLTLRDGGGEDPEID